MSGSTAHRFAAEQADQLLHLLASQTARTLHTCSPNEVHDLRVTIRRITRLLKFLNGCFPRKQSRKIRRRLKKIMVQAGRVRDRDVALKWIGKVAPSAPSPLAHKLEAQRKKAAQTLTASLQRWEHRNSCHKWRKALEPESSAEQRGSAEAIALQLLPRMAKDWFRSGKNAARHNASAEELHQFRIAAKNLRYTLDLFAPLYGASINHLLQQLKALQTLLGEVNDCATVQQMMSRHKAGRSIAAVLDKRQRKKSQQFREHWAAHFTSTTVRRQWTDTLRHVGS